MRRLRVPGQICWYPSTRAVNFRRLNACLEQDFYPLPKISSLLERAGGHWVYFALDATQAYFNLEIQEDSRNLTAFTTLNGLWQFKRMLFRISTTPALYSRFIATVMNPLISEVGQLYLKYIISYNNEVQSHVLQMKLVFNAHLNAGIKLEAKKDDVIWQQH